MATSFKPYDQAQHIRVYGSGTNMYRTAEFAQPKALKCGDRLATGLTVEREPQDTGNGGVEIFLTNRVRRIVAPRIPLQLESDRAVVLPIDMQVGTILETGEVVIKDPTVIDPNDINYSLNRHEVCLTITGGIGGAPIGVPADLAIATYSETYPPDPSQPLGKYAIESVFKMNYRARQNLPALRIGNLELT